LLEKSALYAAYLEIRIESFEKELQGASHPEASHPAIVGGFFQKNRRSFLGS